MNNYRFNPLMFLASLGAGGIAIMPFAFLQYTYPHGAGLIKIADINHQFTSIFDYILFYGLETIMIIFSLIHIIISIVLLFKLSKFIRDQQYAEFINNPLKNSAILAPFISIAMTMNVFIGPIRYFSSIIADNFQMLMLPAIIFWALLFVSLLMMEMKLLKISFEKHFDMSKINFGWLMHPFALGMLTVIGTGIAAMAQSPDIAHTAAFLSLISGSMGMFLFFLKLILIFQKYFSSAEGLGEKQFLPSFLVIIPNITLYAISAFRFGHYLEKHHLFHLDAYFLIVTVLAFAFETWYLLFGLYMLKDYFKNHHFKNEFFVTKWGLICPIVAYGVLGSFVYSAFIPSVLLYWTIIIFTIIAIIFYIDLLIKNSFCFKKQQNNMY